MKATASSISSAPVLERAWAGLFMELVKARLTFLVLLTTLAGFYMGMEGPTPVWLMVHAMCGTALLAGGASALNQYLERDWDARMERTRRRPLPSGRLQPQTALLIGGAMASAGMVQLALGVNLLTSLLGALTLAVYLFVYTPLKRLASFNTAVGAIPGALPPLMGWTAARGEIAPEGWALFAILFFWQLPHFLAIAWLYRDQYQEAGYVMLPCVDPGGKRTGAQAVSHTLGLLPVSLSPFLLGMTGPAYLAGALILGALFLIAAVRFARDMSAARAKMLFYASILYLPLTLGLMVMDSIKS